MSQELARLLRLSLLREHLLSGASIDGHEAAFMLRVCRRSVYRYVEQLRADGLAVQSSTGRHGGFKVRRRDCVRS